MYFDPILKAISQVREVKEVKVVRRPLNYVSWRFKGDRLDVYFPVTDRYLKKAALRVSFVVKSHDMLELKKTVSVIWRFVYYYSIFPFEIIKTMLKSEKIEDLVFYLLKSSLFYLTMDEASFLLLSENQENVKMAFSLTKEAKVLTRYKSTARLRSGLSKKVLERKEPIIVEDVHFEEDINPKMIEKARRTVVAYPLIYGKKVIGILYLNSKKVKKIDKKLVMFLNHILEVVSIQIYRMLLSARYEDTIKKLSLLNEISNVLVKSEKIDDDVLREILGMLKENLNLLQIAILVPQDDRLVVKAEYGYKIDKERFSLKIFEKGITPYVYITGERYYAPNVKFDDKYFFYDRKVRSEAAFPLYRGGTVRGVLDVTSERVNAFSDKDLSLLESVADIISLALVRSFSFERIERDSQEDPLTGLKNRRVLDQEVRNLLRNLRFSNSTCAFVFVDLDGFKQFNDTHGHAEGDRILKKLGKIILDSIRGYDIAIRYGGDEFLLVLPAIRKEMVVAVIERVREKLRKESPMSFSYGIAYYPQDGTTLEELLNKGDMELYKNKKTKKHRS